MVARANPVADGSDREIFITRVVDAPRELVFEAWTRPEHLAKWWGPRGFTTTTHAFDFRVGGQWQHTMHDPDGTDYPNRVVYDEIIWDEVIVYSNHGGIDGVPAQFRSTVTFESEGGKTRITMRQVFRTAAERDVVVQKYGAVEGNKQTLARLDELAREMAFHVEEGKATIVMTRVFDAPRALLFEASTKPEHLARWWGPRRNTLVKCEVDLRPGGEYRFVLRGPDGKDHPFAGEYREVVPPERLVFTQRYDVEPYAKHGSTVSVSFEEHGGKTTVTLVQTFESAFSRDETLKMGAKPGMLESWDRLGELLAQMRAGAGAAGAQKELVLSRVFDAPRPLVFEVWSKPEHLARWLPPRDFTMPKATMDFRPGGKFDHAFRGPDGKEYPFDGVYREIVVPSRIVWSGTIHGGVEVVTTASFEEQDGKTKLTVHQTFSKETDATRGAPSGWGQSLDKLGELLEALTSS
jgi:uncharacterized protein YndB with AHSA1/START domain